MNRCTIQIPPRENTDKYMQGPTCRRQRPKPRTRAPRALLRDLLAAVARLRALTTVFLACTIAITPMYFRDDVKSEGHLAVCQLLGLQFFMYMVFVALPEFPAWCVVFKILRVYIPAPRRFSCGTPTMLAV